MSAINCSICKTKLYKMIREQVDWVRNKITKESGLLPPFDLKQQCSYYTFRYNNIMYMIHLYLNRLNSK